MDLNGYHKMRLIGLMSKYEEYCKLEADVGYPQELRNLQNEYLLVLEKI